VRVTNARLFVVMTGLPASGKTTIGRALSESLRLPHLDKDDVLEVLFDALGADSPHDRSRLSRASDEVLKSMALASQGAVLTSFWRRPRLSRTSGTPSDWLQALESDVLVEVLCDCDPAIAAERFATRARHPAHFDRRRAEDEVRSAFEQLHKEGSVFDRRPVQVDTSGPVDVSAVAARVLGLATEQGWRVSDWTD